MLEACVRDELNITSVRVMAVLNPIKVTITTLPSDHVPCAVLCFSIEKLIGRLSCGCVQVEELTVPNIPGNAAAGSHTVSIVVFSLSPVCFLAIRRFPTFEAIDYFH